MHACSRHLSRTVARGFCSSTTEWDMNHSRNLAASFFENTRRIPFSRNTRLVILARSLCRCDGKFKGQRVFEARDPHQEEIRITTQAGVCYMNHARTLINSPPYRPYFVTSRVFHDWNPCGGGHSDEEGNIRVCFRKPRVDLRATAWESLISQDVPRTTLLKRPFSLTKEITIARTSPWSNAVRHRYVILT